MDLLVDPTRFEVREVLGAGAQGVVHRAHDRRRGVDVALKVIRKVDSLSLLDLKHEFRIASALSHPHLVRLYELFAGNGSCFFTMELVDGRPFDGARDGDRAIQRARAADLTDAVHSLHLAHRLHRDIKPANVLVSPARGTVLLDFGFASTLRGDGEGLGTPVFTAPEILRGAAPTPASDWFSVGASLWEILTGEPVARGQLGEPPAKRPCPTDVDPGLWDLVEAMLRRSPADRPTGAEILGFFERSPRAAELVPSSGDEITRAALVGRDPEVRQLQRLFEASQAGVRIGQILGPSGIGKTALVLGFLDALPAGTVVLRGRCGPREDVPFNALDEVMDVSAGALIAAGAKLGERSDPRTAAALARAFPVFGDLLALEPPVLPADTQELRRLCARGFVELVRSLSDGTTVVWIDDLHWADTDSASLLLLILEEARDARILFLLSTRTELSALRALPERDDVALVPLALDESLALARTWAGEDSVRVEDAARECQGSPLFLRQLIDRMAMRAPAGPLPSLEAAILTSLAALSRPARDLLELLAVAARPWSLATGGEDPEGELGDPDALFLLHDLRLLRGNAGARERTIEIDHDRIREVLVADLAPERRRELHLRVARTLDRQGTRPEEIVFHYAAGGRPEEGARLALHAAEAAASALAFNRAADLYTLVLSMPATEADLRALLPLLARALSKAGRGEEAAAAYLRAAALRAPGEALELRRQASEQLLRVGRIDAGIAVLADVLRELRLPNPGTWLGTLLWLAWTQLAQLATRERAAPAAADPRALQRVDACFSAGLGLNMIDIQRSMLFQSLQLVLARRSGDPARIARSLAVESTYRSTRGSARHSRQAQALLARARTIAGRLEDPEGLAFADLCDGVGKTTSGEFAAAIEQLDAAAERYRAHQDGVTWEVANCDLYKCWSSVYLGRIAALRQLVPRLQREAAERGDALAAIAVESGICAVAGLARGLPDETLARAREARVRLPSGGFESLDYFDLVARVAVLLYRGEGEGAYAAMRAAWSGLRRGFFLNLRFFRVELRFMRARAAIASALDADEPMRRRRIADARRQARGLGRERFAFAQTLRDAIDADLLALEDPSAWRAALARLAGAASAGCPLVGRLAELALAEQPLGLASEVEDPRAFLRLWLPASAALLDAVR